MTIRHFELRYKGDYIAKLRENTETRQCSEVVFHNGVQVHSAEFPASNLGSASRGEYLECMAASIAQEHARKGAA